MCFLALVDVQGIFSKSILRELLLKAARCKSSSVSKSVVGLRHLTRNVMPSVSYSLSTLSCQSSVSVLNCCG